MGKLRAIAPRIGGLASRIKRQADAEGHDRTNAWRGWYNLARWQRLRIRIFVRDNYTCQMRGCGKVTSRPIADHIKPHRGDPTLFWADGNVQTLCKPCHDSLKQAEERRARPGG